MRTADSLQNKPKVAIIILNWNGWDDTIECIESVHQITYTNYDTIVIDNASDDDSIQKITDYANGNLKPTSNYIEYLGENKPLKIISYSRETAETGGGLESEIADIESNRKMILIRNEKNLGFAEGNNVGIRYAIRALSPDYILLLNNDTIVDKHFLDKLVESAESDSRISAIGPKIYYYDYGGKRNIIQSLGGYVNWFFYPGYHSICDFEDVDKADFRDILDRDFISGAAIMIRTSCLRSDLLDNAYFFGCEDVDFCIRLRRKGGRTVIRPDSYIWHKVGVARDKNPDLRTGEEIGTLMKRVSYNLRFTKRTTHGYVIYIPTQVAHIGLKFIRKKIYGKDSDYHPIIMRIRFNNS